MRKESQAHLPLLFVSLLVCGMVAGLSTQVAAQISGSQYEEPIVVPIVFEGPDALAKALVYKLCEKEDLIYYGIQIMLNRMDGVGNLFLFDLALWTRNPSEAKFVEYMPMSESPEESMIISLFGGDIQLGLRSDCPGRWKAERVDYEKDAWHSQQLSGSLVFTTFCWEELGTQAVWVVNQGVFAVLDIVLELVTADGDCHRKGPVKSVARGYHRVILSEY